MRRITVEQRRARLARRHRLAPGWRAGDVLDAARSMVCLHATDPATVYLSAWARVDGMTVAAMDRALYDDRSLVKHLAMRRTLFAFPRDILGAAQAGASNRVAGAERRRLAREVEAAGLHADGGRWLNAAGEQVLAVLTNGRQARSSELREEIPLLAGSTRYGEGKPWGGQVPVGPRVLTVLSAEGRIVRSVNDGGWTVSRPLWASMAGWLGHDLEPLTEDRGLATLVTAWLRAFGPGTAADGRWWLGSTVGAIGRALAQVGAVEVDLDGQIGFVLPGDAESDDDEPPVEPWAALLPSLDPTTMGWTERDWYLGPHRAQVFDRNGNAGPTVWWDGRVVGGWRQGPSGDVELQLLEDIGADGRQAAEREADRLTTWLAGTRVAPRYPSPLSKAAGASG